MSQNCMSEQLTEQLIKNNLYRIGLEENRFNSEDFMQTSQKSNYLPNKSYSFREVSDWSNRYRIEQDSKLSNALQSCKSGNGESLAFSKYSFLISKRHRVEQEPNQMTKKKKNLELSPITVKFHSQKTKEFLRKSSNSPRRMQEQNSTSFYESNYGPLSLLYELKTRERREGKSNKQEELPLVLPQFNELKLPKTERISSIMRLMKKHQQIRVYKQKRFSPEKFQLLKLP